MKHLLRFYILVFLLTSDFKLFAQPSDEPGDDNGDGTLEGDDPIPGAPINSKVFLLVVIGVAFAWYKFQMKRQKA